jgi:periplasmic divalent cation tolerance protein
MKEDVLVVLVTAPTLDEATSIGRTLVEERLAACANIVPGLRSIYRWQDALQDEPEVLLIIKTTAAYFDHLAQRVLELHSYATPEVLALPVTQGVPEYVQWLIQQVGPKSTS